MKQKSRYVSNIKFCSEAPKNYTLHKIENVALIITLAGSIGLIGVNFNHNNCEVIGYYMDGYQTKTVTKEEDGYTVKYKDGKTITYTMEELEKFVNPNNLQAVTQETPDGHQLRISTKHNELKSTIESSVGYLAATGSVYALSKRIGKKQKTLIIKK